MIKGLRELLIRKGVCTTCKNAMAMPGYIRCERCVSRSKRRQQTLREREALGYCITCGKNRAAEGRSQCRSCLDRRAGYNKGRQLDAKAGHLCTRCHKPMYAKSPYSYCYECREQQQRYNVIHKERMNNAGERMENR